jgi:glycosyltransferase involved in cell wall biosynthesis
LRGRPNVSAFFRAAATVFVANYDQALAKNDALMSRQTRHLVIHNGSAATDQAAEALSKPAFDIVFLGRLHPQKNPLALADILLALRPLAPTLGIIGVGECEAALRERLQQVGAAHQVRFLGSRPSAEALGLLAQSRVMVLPSVSEGLPVAVIEAMQLGVPTVASNVGGLGELIDDGDTGFLVQPDDMALFADRLRCLLLNEPRRLRMGRAAQARARSTFSIERNVERHLGLYNYVAWQPKTDQAGLILAEQSGA